MSCGWGLPPSPAAYSLRRLGNCPGWSSLHPGSLPHFSVAAWSLCPDGDPGVFLGKVTGCTGQGWGRQPSESRNICPSSHHVGKSAAPGTRPRLMPLPQSPVPGPFRLSFPLQDLNLVFLFRSFNHPIPFRKVIMLGAG